MKTILSVDIGGTNSRFAIFSVDDQDNSLILEKEEWISTNDADSFENLIEIASQKINVDDHSTFVFAVPGLVNSEHYAKLVNVSWGKVDILCMKERIQQKGGNVYLINDFVAQAFGCLSDNIVNPIEIKSGVLSGKKVGLSIVGAGTGLGHCTLLINENGTLTPIPSQAGQSEFPFLVEENEYQLFLQSHLGVERIRYDDVVSNYGLVNLHFYLTSQLISPIDAANEIGRDSETVRYFARFFGRGCRNYVLSVLPVYSVLYLSGGVATNLPFLVDNDIFRDEFIQSSEQEVLNQIPIKLTQNKSLGLWGAAQYAIYQIQQMK
jgi:glucokinase